MIRHLVRAALLVTLLGAPAAAQSPLWRSVEVSRQLRDSLPKRIRVQYAAGRVDVRSSGDRLLYDMHLQYDERRAVPLHSFDAEQHAVSLGVESRGAGLRGSGRDDESGELRLALSRVVPLDLALEFGGTRATMELGGLLLQSLRMECGATEATLSFASLNRVRMREFDINVGAAEFTATGLANANADLIRLRGGVGGVDLDFGGSWTRDLAVTTRLAVGKLTLRVPRDVGIRLEVQRVATGLDHQGLEKRGDAWYSDNWESAPHKLRIRAESFFGQIDLRRTAP